MRTKAEERFTVDKADQISVTVTVDFEQLGDTEEYKALKSLESVLLYDTVTVRNEEISLSLQLYVEEWEWDAIREKITALKLVNTADYKKGNVTGYNVQAKSISGDKLMDDVKDEIIGQVVDIIPEYADPQAERPSSNINVIDNLNSDSGTDALSAKQGKVLNGKLVNENRTSSSTHEITIASNTRHIIFVSAANSESYGWGGIVSASSNGTVRLLELGKGSGVTAAASTNKLTLTFSSAGGCTITDIKTN